MANVIELDLTDIMKQGNLPEPDIYQYYKNLSNNTIIINYEIDTDFLEWGILPLLDMDKNPDVEHIDIIISSPGGDIYSGFAFVSILESLKTPTTLRVIGMAASMGTLIAMAKNPNLHVVCDKWSVGLIHSGSQCMEGSVHSVKDTFRFSEKYEEKIKQYILSHTKIDEELYSKIERYEWWLDADDMLKYGIVDEII